MVASATPNTPQPSFNTKNRSRDTFTILDKIRKYKGVLESPRALRIAATPLYSAIPTIPIQLVLI